MGQPKGLLKFGNQPLILRIASILEPIVYAVTVVGATACYHHLRLHMIEDFKIESPGETGQAAGPLCGIASALVSSRTDWNLILACDLPYLSATWVDWVLARALRSKRQIVMPRTAAGIEPLAAVYRRECAGPIIEALYRGVRKVSDGLEGLQIEFVTERDWGRADPTGRVLYNMNAPEDYEEARKWLEHGDS